MLWSSWLSLPHFKMALVQESNWSKSDVKPGDDVGDLVCPKHRCNGQGRKSILVHVIDGFVIEESNVPFQVGPT